MSNKPSLRSNEQILSYLTPKAQEALQTLTNAGMDCDLALSVVESQLSDSEMYTLEPLDGRRDEE